MPPFILKSGASVLGSISLGKSSAATMHYGIRAMGAMSLRISELFLSFSPHPNISDGNFNLVHYFFRMQIFQINEKGARL